jgi:acyl-CoA reductase-like NAD-dependent aldehyde dehydrogenase
VAAQPKLAAMPSYQRREVLEYCVQEFTARQEELAMALCVEAGKPIKVPLRLVLLSAMMRGIEAG